MTELPDVKHREIDITQAANPVDELVRIIEHAVGGTRVIYSRGPHMTNYRVGERALKLFQGGLCDLVQRRHRAGRHSTFEYLAIKRKSPRARPHWHG